MWCWRLAHDGGTAMVVLPIGFQLQEPGADHRQPAMAAPMWSTSPRLTTSTAPPWAATCSRLESRHQLDYLVPGRCCMSVNGYRAAEVEDAMEQVCANRTPGNRQTAPSNREVVFSSIPRR
jgi:hypothetical protein